MLHWRPKFEFASKFGGHPCLCTWSFCCSILILFANAGLKSSFKAVGPSCNTKILIRIKIGWSSSIDSWSNSLRILIALQIDALSSSCKALGDPFCYSELRILHCISCILGSLPDLTQFELIFSSEFGGPFWGFSLFCNWRLKLLVQGHR